MKTVFGDTFYYLALVNPADAAHERVQLVSQQLRAKVLTTMWVLTEVADALAAPGNRSVFTALLNQLTTDANTTIVPFSEDLFHRAILLYQGRADKHWSLTDCTSFVAMQDAGLTEALTADHHFEQAGFVALLK